LVCTPLPTIARLTWPNAWGRSIPARESVPTAR